MALTVIPASGGGTGTSFPSVVPPIFVNTNTVSANYTMAANTNGVSAGPVTINTGVSVTIPTGSKWVIL
jgi:hypothetical protein